MEPVLTNFMGEAELKVLDVGEEEPLLEVLVVEPVADTVVAGLVFVVPKPETEAGGVYEMERVDEVLVPLDDAVPLDDEVVVDVLCAAMEKPPLVE